MPSGAAALIPTASPIAEQVLPSHDVVDRANVLLGSLRADHAWSHLVHHVRDRHAAADIHEDDRAAPAAPEADLLVGNVRKRGWQCQAVPDTKAERRAKDEVDAVGLLAEDQLDGLGPQQPDPVDLAATGNH